MKKIDRIFIFGDSWMEGQGTFDIETLDEWDNKYPFDPQAKYGSIGWKRKEESWNKFFKERYNNIEVKNYAEQGASNYRSFEHLNENLKDFKDTDLILFGFTSKWRDSSNIKYAWQQMVDGEEGPSPVQELEGSLATGYHKDTIESKNPTEFEKYFYSSIFDEDVYENIAQTNYLFYQTYAKDNNLNIIFFDLFDKYVDINKCKPSLRYLIDKNMYITFGKETYMKKLVQYELDNYDIDKMPWNLRENQYTIWEFENGGSPPGKRFPKIGDDIHPNQFGYKVIFEDLNTYINKKYTI
jgi:hypothetical protein